MTPPKITTLDKLREYLRIAMVLEHATIPPYLTALYSIRPQTNSDATHILRVVAVEEMLHLTLAANILNAVGGKPDLTAPGFVPTYPTYLPNGETDFKVDLQSFSHDAIENFLQIERPAPAPDEDKRVKSQPRTPKNAPGRVLGCVPSDKGDTELRYYSIGEFYEEIIRGLKHLYHIHGRKMFSGDLKRQATSGFYYSGGGELFPVTCLESAVAAANLIIEQGEGLGGGIYGKENELAHMYRFDQLKKGQYYKPGDKADNPTGPRFTVDWGAVYTCKKNARLSDYQHCPELLEGAIAFNKFYAGILALLTAAFNGQPELLLKAVPEMFKVRDRMSQLLHVPIPGMDGVYAAPTFEVNAIAAGVAP